MPLRWGYGLGLALVGLSLTPSAQAQFQAPRLSGVFETYTVASGSDADANVAHTLRYMSLSARVSPQARLVGGFLTFRERDSLEENYLELGAGVEQWRIGRFRTAFGLSDWSDNYYAGFPRMAMLRTATLGSVRMNRLDTGIEWRGGSPALQHQVALVDAQSGPNQITPGRPQTLSVRTQASHKNLLIGLNSLVGFDQSGRGETRLFDVDWRWSVPHFQARGELLFGESAGRHPAGFYQDFFYHPPRMTRTTFLGRVEAVSTGATRRGFAHLYTVGVKQILSPLLTLELTNSWSNAIEPARGRRGWALQLVTFSRL